MKKISKKNLWEYHNAIDCIYYGYGFKFWRHLQKELGSKIDENTALEIWKAAFDFLAQ